MEQPSVAIVILNWNGKNYLEQFLPPLLQSTYPSLKFYVADNASADGSVGFVRERFPQVEIIQLAQNFGFAQGYNLALGQVSADYYVLLNSDVQVEPGWVEPLVNLLERQRKIAACQPKLLSFSDPGRFEYAGACGGWLDVLGYPFARGRVFDDCELDHGQYNQAAPIFWASGAALFIRAAAFHEVGGFDPYFFAHQEEIDLCWRLQLAGYQVYSCPRSVVYHVGGGTLPQGNSLKTFLNFRNNSILLYKNLRWWNWLPIMALRSVLDLLAAFKSLVGGDGGYFRAVLKAMLSFWVWFFFRQKKSVFPKNKPGAKLYGAYRGSVVWQYFVRGKKKFSEIVAKEPGLL